MNEKDKAVLVGDLIIMLICGVIFALGIYLAT